MSNARYRAVILDMHGTFMFGHDRFDDFGAIARHYRSAGGLLSAGEAERLLVKVHETLAAHYRDGSDRMPSVAAVIRTLKTLSDEEVARLQASYAYFECGYVPADCRDALATLAQRHRLALLSDIWAPRTLWVERLSQARVWPLFQAAYFSSDKGQTKPSPNVFARVLRALGLTAAEVLMVGDSPERDIQGAHAVGMDTALVGARELAPGQAPTWRAPDLPQLVGQL